MLLPTMKISRNTYVIGSVGIFILLVFLITLIVALVESSTDDDPSTDLPSIDPNEIPLPFANALIVKINNCTLWTRDIDGDSSMYLIKNWTAPFHSFDFHRRKTIYFGSAFIGRAITSYSKQYPQLSQPGMWFANKIAADDVHEMVYVLDGLAEKIDVFDIHNAYYNVISIDLNQPKDIAIDPLRRFLFVLQLSSILKTNLDGTLPKTIVERTDMSTFQIDVNGRRIYWATTRDIQSVDYSGRNSIIVEKIANPVISLAMSNNNLYWLNPSRDYEKARLWLCKITNNGVCKDTTSVIFDDNALEIKAYNFDRKKPSNPCDSLSNCEHMCVVDANNKPRCVCNIGWQLKGDSQWNSCEAIDEFLLYVQGDFVKGRLLNISKDRDAFAEALLPIKLNISLLTKKQVLDFDYDARNREFVFSDDYSVNKISLKPGSRQVLIGGESKDKKINPAVDWVTRNVYYVRITYYDYFHIAVRNIEPYDYSTADKVFLVMHDNQTPRALALHPNRGLLFVTLIDDLNKNRVQILRANLDGTGKTIFGGQNNLSISDRENGLTIDYEENRLFWFHANLTKVQSADLECSDLRSIDVSIVANPTMMSIHGGYIYVSNLTSVWRFNKKSAEDRLKVLPIFSSESQTIRGAKVFSAKSQIVDGDYPCAVNNGGCKRYCFAKPNINSNKLERVCECNGNEKLGSDGKNCIGISSK